MGKTRRLLLLAVLIAMLGFVSWLVLSQPSEPVYQGKPLSFWCDQYASSVGQNPDFDLHGRATSAISTIGTNAIPTLLRWLKARDSKFKLKFIELASKQHVINLRWKTAEERHYEAANGFGVLRSDGKSAIPALLEIYNGRNSDPNDNLRYTDAHFIFGCMGPAAADAVPRLVQDTTDTNIYIRWDAILALARIHAKPELTVPALTRSLRDPDQNVRESAAKSLDAFGSD